MVLNDPGVKSPHYARPARLPETAHLGREKLGYAENIPYSVKRSIRLLASVTDDFRMRTLDAPIELHFARALSDWLESVVSKSSASLTGPLAYAARGSGSAMRPTSFRRARPTSASNRRAATSHVRAGSVHGESSPTLATRVWYTMTFPSLCTSKVSASERSALSTTPTCSKRGRTVRGGRYGEAAHAKPDGFDIGDTRRHKFR